MPTTDDEGPKTEDDNEHFRTPMLTTSQPRTLHFRSLSPHGFHRVVYYEWGERDNPNVVVCVHGIGRNGRDFDVLAESLSTTHRVVAPDMPGRGASEWLREPMDYVAPTYLVTLAALMAASRVDEVQWVGTSMGGLLGMMAAATPGTPIRKLVVNDVGPVIEAQALARIGQYFGMDPTFATYDEFKTYVKTISAPFGPLTEEQWEHVARTNSRQRDNGRFGVNYDPAIAVPFRAQPSAGNLWPVWDQIRCPTLVLRGAESDLLSHETAQEMTTRGPHARLVEFAQVGHAPMLLARDQVDIVVDFLRSTV